MMRKRHLVQNCPICQKTLEAVSSLKLGLETLTSYKCGHSFSEAQLQVDKSSIDITSADGLKTLRDYQIDGVEFILESDFNCIIGDQMRLGKTPQALMALKNHYAERTPCLHIVRSANTWQWVREHKSWVDTSPMGIWPISGTKSWIPPGFKTYIISMDTLGRPGTCKSCKHTMHDNGKDNKCRCKTCKCTNPVDAGDSVLSRLKEIDFKLIIADEAHSFKNDDSQRSRALVEFLTEKNTLEAERTLYYSCPFCKHAWDVQDKYKVVNGQPQQVYRGQQKCESCGAYIGVAKESSPTTHRRCGVILLTGTAIKNRADEYYIPLNLVAPDKFPSRQRFRNRWLEQDCKGQWSHINRYAMDQFKSEISPYVLRREKEDVYTDLPPLNRMFTLIEPDKDALSEQYNKILDKVEATLAERANPSYWDMADDMMKLRKICGLMKVMWTADYIESCIADNTNDNNGRIAVGIHHHDVRDILKFKLSHLGTMTLSGEDSAEKKDWIMRNFATSPEKILILNTLAGGVGMDFHYCHNVLILERQWSFADEQQFEFRFYNPDKSIQGDFSTNVEYIVAKGTMDEWWFNMVESKKQIQGETIGTQWDLKTQPMMFKQLMEETVSHRL